MRLTISIYILNISIGILCIAILALLIHADILSDALEETHPELDETRKIPLSLLYWPGCGGIVDCLLFVGLSIGSRVSSLCDFLRNIYLAASCLLAGHHFIEVPPSD